MGVGFRLFWAANAMGAMAARHAGHDEGQRPNRGAGSEAPAPSGRFGRCPAVPGEERINCATGLSDLDVVPWDCHAIRTIHLLGSSIWVKFVEFLSKHLGQTALELKSQVLGRT